MDYIWLKALHVAAVLVFVGGLFVQAIGIAAGAKGATETVDLISRWDQRVTLAAMLTVWLTGRYGVQSARLRKLWQGVQVASGTHPFTVAFAIAGAVSVIAILAVASRSESSRRAEILPIFDFYCRI